MQKNLKVSSIGIRLDPVKFKKNAKMMSRSRLLGVVTKPFRRYTKFCFQYPQYSVGSRG